MDEITKNKLIKKEIRVLKKIIKNLDEDKKRYADRLIEQAAFMYVTLQELQEAINSDGAVEWFENGKQKMWREHPAAKTYNTMIKNYTSVIKQLSDISPNQDEKDELMEFLNEHKK